MELLWSLELGIWCFHFRLVSYFQAVIFNHRIAQQLMCGVVDGFLRGGFVRAGREINLDVFADVDAGDAGVAHVYEGFFDGDTLRVNDRLFGCDDNFGLHAKLKRIGWFSREKSVGIVAKPRARGEEFLCASKFSQLDYGATWRWSRKLG